MAVVVTTMAAVTLAAAAAMATVEARMTATVVTSSAGSVGGKDTTMDSRDAILPWYADVVNVRRDNDDNRTPAFTGGNIDSGVADKLIKNQEGVHAMQAAVVDQAAAAVTTIKVPTIWKTFHLKKIDGGKRHAQGWCLCSGCKKQTTYVCSRCTHKTDGS